MPWFGTQLMNGNSLIGARRQVYRIENAQSTSKGLRWYEMEPDRVPLGTKRMPKKQVYHFLLGDPGMCSYSDKVIKQLEPANIKEMKDWNKKFTSPVTDDEVVTLLRLSEAIDKLWEAQIELRKEVGAKTQDALSIFGYTDDAEDSHTTIRQKDKIFSELYKSEHMRNAGPYARLKFAMDYWCALWFWPIDQADLLPTRSEFLFDMSLILEGTMASVKVTDSVKGGQMTLFPTEMEQLALDIIDTYGTDTVVDIPRLRKENPRLDLAARIAEQNHFMHWELEFADLFAERGGFDLILGNPPWVKIQWNEQNTLSDKRPMFMVKNLSANQTTHHRAEALEDIEIKELYFSEFGSIAGQQSFLNAVQNYPLLVGQQTNLFKCFLPQAWNFCKDTGTSAFIHPEGVYDDPKGGVLREEWYPRLKYHFQFQNERKLFHEVANRAIYSINIYNNKQSPYFDSISNLFDPKTIDECYASDGKHRVGGIKTDNGEWNVEGHKQRIIKTGREQLTLYSCLFDDGCSWKQARLPVLHIKVYTDILSCFCSEQTLGKLGENIYTTQMWQETGAQNDGTIKRDVHFPLGLSDYIYSGPHFSIANPLFQASQQGCNTHRAFDNIDLNAIPVDYMQRCNYSPACDMEEYFRRVPKTPWGDAYTDCYRIIVRRMLNQSGERTLIPAIIPPHVGHVHTVFGFAFHDPQDLVSVAGSMSSLVFDGFIKITGRSDFYFETASNFPYLVGPQLQRVKQLTLMLNCLTSNYADLWVKTFSQDINFSWSKNDHRLNANKVRNLSGDWSPDSALRGDYERRYALVEIDVLTAMAIGLSLEQLCTLYRAQFPVLKMYEDDTWYDANGRIVFTNNRSLTGVGVDRKTWENVVRNLPAGKSYFHTILDDTVQGGPVERTIEYVAPFDRCDREQDYETAWKFFEEKYREG